MIRKRLFPFICLLAATLSAEELTLDTAIERALSESTALKTAQLEIEVRNAQSWQDSLYPNPSAMIEVDSFGGKHENSGFDNADVSYSITQLILLGGKRCARLKLDHVNNYAATIDYDILMQDTLLELIHAYVDAYVCQEKLDLARNLHEVAAECLNIAKGKVQSGKESALQEKKAALAVCSCRISISKAESANLASREILSALWESEEPDFERISFPLYELSLPPSLSELEEALFYSPDLAKAETAVDAAIAATDLERALGVPDLEVSAGVGNQCGFRDGGFSDNGFFVSLSMPLPIFDRNQGNICRASLQSWQAAYARQNAEVTAAKNLKAAWRAWSDAYQNARAYVDLEQAFAQETLQTTEESFQQGKVERQDWMDAKKSWLETKQQTLDALAEYHIRKAETLRIIAQLPYMRTCDAKQAP